MPKTVSMSKADIDRRADQAQGFLDAGKKVKNLWDEPSSRYSEDTVATVVGSLVILSGIACADVIVGLYRGYRNDSGSHNEATLLLQKDVPEASTLLLRLLQVKNVVQYSTTFTSMHKATELVEIATKLYRVMLREYNKNN